MTDSNRFALRVDRFMRMPRRTGDVWQGAGVLLPIFAADPETGEPVRQGAIAWSNTATGDVILASASAAEVREPARILDAFLDFASRSRKVREGRPARIEVRDEAVGRFLKETLGDEELEVVVVAEMPRIDEEIETLILTESPDAVVPGVLSAPGVTLNRLHAFADAAALFYERRLWHEIGPEDLVVLESPAPDGMAGFAVDYGGGQPVVNFYSSRGEFEELFGDDDDLDEEPDEDDTDDDGRDWLVEDEDEEGEEEEDRDEFGEEGDEYEERSAWIAEFVQLHELPARDVNAWADMGLPAAAPDGYPAVTRREEDGEFTRPDSGRLAFLEGLFRALADTTEVEIDSGRWQRNVATADGPATYRFVLTTVVDDSPEAAAERDKVEESGAVLSRFLDEGEFETLADAISQLEQSGRPKLTYRAPEGDEERAQDLVYRASVASGRRRTQLLRRALAISPDSFAAFLHLAEHATRPAEALELFERGRAAAQRAIGLDRLAELKGRYWEDRQARLYLRLRLGLALALRSLGRREEALAELQEVVALDDQDRGGVRDYLLALLLLLGRDEQAWDLVARFEADSSTWLYGSALLAFRTGNRRLARELLSEAYAASPSCATLLISETLGPSRAAIIERDDETGEHDAADEAEECLDLLEEPWLRTPGALEWMLAELKPSRTRGASRRSGRSGRRGRR